MVRFKLVVCSLLVVSCIACQKQATRSSYARINMDSSPRSLDPRLASDRNERTIAKSLYEGLMRLSPTGIVYGMADSVEVSEDQKAYEFHLRCGYWSDGEKVTADDFVYAWKGLLAPDFPASHAHLFYVIQGAEEAKQGVGALDAVRVFAVDQETLRVELKHPAPYFLELTAHPIFSPVPAHRVEQRPDDWFCHRGGVSNGPFCLADWKLGEKLVLQIDPNFRDRLPHLEGIEISFIEDGDTALTLYHKGELDFMGTPFHDLSFEAIPHLHDLQRQSVGGVYWLDCNTERFPMNCRAFRRALNLALDRGALVTLLAQDPATVVDHILPCTTLSSPWKMPQKDFAAVSQQAQEEMGTSFKMLAPIKILCSDVAGQKMVAQAIQQQWREKLGLASEIHFRHWSHFIAQMREGDFDVAGLVYDAPFNDPVVHLEKFKSRESNFSRWESRDFSQTLERVQEAHNPAERQSLTEHAMNLLFSDAPIIPICCDEFKYVHRLEDIFISPLGYADFLWARLANNGA